MKFNLSKIILFTALIFGILLRLIDLGTIPVSLYWDEAAIGVDAYTVSQWGKDIHGNPAIQAIYPSYGDYKLPLYILVDSLFVGLFGLSPWSVRLPSALAGVGLIILSYLISKELYKNEKVAAITALVMAILPIDVLFSRTGFEGHLATFFVALCLFLWIKSIHKPWLLFISTVVSAMAVYCYFSARIVIPLMGIVTFLSFFKQTSKKWKLIFVISFSLWAGLLMPIFNSPFYEASNQFRLSTQNLMNTGPFALESNLYRQQSENLLIGRGAYHRYLLQTKAIAGNIAEHLNPQYLFISGDSNLRHSTGMVGVMYLGMLPLFLTGWLILARKKLNIAIWLGGLWLASIVPAAIPTEVPHSLRSLNSVVILAPIVGYGAYQMFKKIPKVTLLFTVVIGVEVLLFIHDYSAHYPARSAQAWQDGYFQLADYLSTNQDTYDKCIVDVADGRLFLYFLFQNKVTEALKTTSDMFNFSKVGKCEFKQVETSDISPKTWMVFDAPSTPLASYNKITTIVDKNNQPVFDVVGN